jgi:hypothetical protein
MSASIRSRLEHGRAVLPRGSDGLAEADDRARRVAEVWEEGAALYFADSEVGGGELLLQCRIRHAVAIEPIEILERGFDDQLAGSRRAGNGHERVVDVEDHCARERPEILEPALGQAGLPGARDRCRGQGGAEDGGHADGHPMAARRSQQSIGDTLGPGANRIALADGLEIVAELFHRGVAAIRVLGHRLRQHCLQVAAQPPRDVGRQPGNLAGALRLLRQHRLHQLVDPIGAKRVRTRAGEDHVAKRAERVYVRHRRNRGALELLRARVGRRHRPMQRDVRRVQLPGDAEVQQLDGPVVGDQHVLRLDVAVDDQVAVGVGDAGADLQQQRDPFVHGGAALGAVPVDRDALHEFHHQVEQMVGRGPGIEEPRDIGMLEARQQLPLAHEPVAHREKTRRQELHGHALGKRAVASLGQVHRAGAAGAEEPQEPIGTDDPARQIAGRGQGWQLRQELTRAFVRLDERHHFERDEGIGDAEIREELRARLWRQREGPLEQVCDPGPHLGRHPHGSCLLWRGRPRGSIVPNISAGKVGSRHAGLSAPQDGIGVPE